MWRAIRIVMIALLLPVVTAMPVPATGQDPASVLALSALWSKVLETPSGHNPFGSGGVESGCLTLAPGVISAFAPNGVPACTVNPGTTLVVVPDSIECSTFEGTSPRDLTRCAQESEADVTKVTLTVDGKAVPTVEVSTGFIPVVLPPDNLFGERAGVAGLSVADGWVAIVTPLAPGRTHCIVESVTRPDEMGKQQTKITITRFTVRPWRHR